MEEQKNMNADAGMRFDDGLYVYVESRRDRSVACTAELGNGDVFVDYDSEGNVIGVEFLEKAIIETDDE